MRTWIELRHRLAQEIRNVWLAAQPPRLNLDRLPPSPLPQLPDPAAAAARLRGTPFEMEARRLAASIGEHRFPLLGISVNTGPEIRWRRDYQNSVETGLRYFRLIPYLDFQRAGDHKIIWELNRHQHLVLLAQAGRMEDDPACYGEIFRQLESWLDQNPFGRGINWASALEAAFRALSWAWIWHLAGEYMPARLARRFLEGLYHHGLFVENNLSFYFSPNTHLLGEAVTLHALGSLFPEWPRAARWRETGARLVRQEMERQVQEDGSHFEQSTYYHVYALDMFLFHAVLEKVSDAYRERLARMADFLEALMGPARRLVCFGDDDGGRWFHPYGRRDEFGRASLATCSQLSGAGKWAHEAEDLAPQAAWWLGAAGAGVQVRAEAVSRRFDSCGLIVMNAAGRQVIFDTGGFGSGSGGHSHSDALSVTARNGGEEILIDPGTYTYVADAALRRYFRGSAAHNTVVIDGRDQAEPSGPFSWRGRPRVALRQWSPGAAAGPAAAGCGYAKFSHRRRVTFYKPDVLVVEDEIDGPPGWHEVRQYWHPGREEFLGRILAPGGEILGAWRSEGCGH